MRRHQVLIAASIVSIAIAQPSATVYRWSPAMHAQTAGRGHLRVFGMATPGQPRDPTLVKLDGALADIARRYTAPADPSQALAALRTLNPAARFSRASVDSTPLVLIDAVTRGDVQALKAELGELGLRGGSVFANDVGGWLPVDALAQAGALADLHSIRAAMPRTAVAVSTQGDFVQRSSVVRANNSGLIGSGVLVGVLSDSFNCYQTYASNGVQASGPTGYASNGFLADYAADVKSGALPSGVTVLEEASCMDYGAPTQLPFTDEGRAILQILHEVAPGADLAFYTAANSEADFANGIVALANAGAQIIDDDVMYPDEPIFQDGLIAQAIDQVAAKGVTYFSSTGNNGHAASNGNETLYSGYDNTSPAFPVTSTQAPNEKLLNFDTSGATTTTSLPLTIASLVQGEFLTLVVEWDQPYVTGATGSPGASSAIDLCITASGPDMITDLDGNPISCTGPNALGTDPVQVIVIGNPANSAGSTATENVSVSIGLVNGTTKPGRIKFILADDGAGSTINGPLGKHSATMQGHAGAAGAAAVGAAFYFNTPQCDTSPATLEYFSSAGGDPILFDTSGNRLATPLMRQKPQFVGPDGDNDTFLGFTLASQSGFPSNGQLPTSISQCQNDASYPNFFGTSAAAPHVAGIAALMLQANSALTTTQMISALEQSALPMGGSAPNADAGYGFVQADAAFALLPPAAPTLSLSSSSVALGGKVTLTWSAFNVTSCAASGAWSGAVAASGTQSEKPSATGTSTYTLTCSNAAGSANSSANLTVTQPPSSGGGGGSLGLMTLAILGSLLTLSLSRRRLLFKRPCSLTIHVWPI